MHVPSSAQVTSAGSLFLVGSFASIVIRSPLQAIGIELSTVGGSSNVVCLSLEIARMNVLVPPPEYRLKLHAPFSHSGPAESSSTRVFESVTCSTGLGVARDSPGIGQ